jgi:molybdate transport system substrate-binding protein
MGRSWTMAMAMALAAAGAVQAQPAVEAVAVYAAGSLRAALTDIAAAFERDSQLKVRLTFGASGLLKDRIVGGEAAQVFASANMAHPLALRDAGRADFVAPFARNALCGLAAPEFSVQGRTLAQRLLDRDVRVGISTPGADPSGDYAFEMFERIEATGAGPAGSAAALKAKALQLTGGPQLPPPPPERSVYGALIAAGQADVFITYCTNAVQARREVPVLQVIAIPDAINVAATYGIATVSPASVEARRFVDFVLAAQGRKTLTDLGFGVPP